MNTCATCHWFDDSGDDGLCRRNAPGSMAKVPGMFDPASQQMFGVCKSTDWCGEWTQTGVSGHGNYPVP